MPVPVQCEQCGAKYLIEDKFAGKRAKCKRCGHIMSIPLPDADSVETESHAPSALPPLEGVTSQPPRSWRPQDIVVERGEDVTNIPLDAPYQPVMPRAASDRMDWIAPVALLLFVVGLVGTGILVQLRFNEIPPEQLETFGGGPGLKMWILLAIFAVSFFAIVGPLALGGIVIASRIMRFTMPGSAYLRATGLAAVPAVLLIGVMLLSLLGVADGGAIGIVLLLIVPVCFLATRYVLGTDWLSTVASFIGAAMLGGIGFVIAVNVMSFAKGAIVTDSGGRKVVQKTPLPRPPTPSSTTPSPPAPEIPPAPPSDPDPGTATPAPAEDPPGAQPPVRPVNPLVRRTSPAPITIDPRSIDPSETIAGEGFDTTAEITKSGENAAAIAKRAADDLLERIREAAGPLVSDAGFLPLAEDVISIVRPIAPSQAFAVVAATGQQERIEVWSGSPPTKLGQAAFKVEPHNRANYALSADGQRFLRIAEFPKLAARVTSVATGRELGAVELDSTLGTPKLLGFLNNDRFLIRWERGSEHGLETWDLKTRRHGRRIALAEHDPSPGNEAVSPDGRLFATATRVKGKSAVVVHAFFDNTAPRRFPIDALDERWEIRPAGIAFSADNSKIAALFVHQGNALVVAWNTKTGQPLQRDGVVLSGVFQPLEQLPGAAIGRAGVSAHSFDWLPGGNAWLVCGSSVIDATTGDLLADLAASDVFDQAVAGDRFVHLAFKDKTRPTGMALLTLDPKQLPATRPSR